jgi:hypothetical protein
MAGNPNSGRKAKPPLEVSEAQRSFKGQWHYRGWADPGGHGTYKSEGDWHKTQMAGYDRSKPHRNPTVASSDFGKLERASDRQIKRIKGKESRAYGGMRIPGKSYPLGIQKGHGMRGR